jgi:hypothetical protein
VPEIVPSSAAATPPRAAINTRDLVNMVCS